MFNINRICKFTLFYALLIMFILKYDFNNSFRSIVNYRSFNYIIILIEYLISLISEMQNKFRKTKYFTKINLKAKFNLMRIKKKGIENSF